MFQRRMVIFCSEITAFSLMDFFFFAKEMSSLFLIFDTSLHLSPFSPSFSFCLSARLRRRLPACS